MSRRGWLPVASIAGAMFLGVLGYEAGRAGAGGDPALPAPAKAAADASAPQQQPPGTGFDDEPGSGADSYQQAPGRLAAPTTRQS